MKTIKEFCQNNKIILPQEGTIEYSDVYVEIYRKFDSSLKEWTTIEPDGKPLKRALRLYEEKDLEKHFNQNKQKRK